MKCYKGMCGLLCTILVYVFLVQMYLATVITCIADQIMDGSMWGYVNLLLVTALAVMATIAHVQCVVTEPGYLPENYEQLNEGNLCEAFLKLMKERETMYIASEKRRMLRKESNAIEEEKKEHMEDDEHRMTIQLQQLTE